MDTSGSIFDLPDAGPLPASARRQGELDVVEKVRVWMDLHLHEDISWERLVRVSGMPAARLQELFRRHLKTTPMMYLRTRRLMSSPPVAAPAPGKLPGSVLKQAKSSAGT